MQKYVFEWLWRISMSWRKLQCFFASSPTPVVVTARWDAASPKWDTFRMTIGSVAKICMRGKFISTYRLTKGSCSHTARVGFRWKSFENLNNTHKAFKYIKYRLHARHPLWDVQVHVYIVRVYYICTQHAQTATHVCAQTHTHSHIRSVYCRCLCVYMYMYNTCCCVCMCLCVFKYVCVYVQV